MLSRATEADAPTLIPIGRAAFANNRLFNIFQPDPENDKVSLADQQAAYLSWRTERSTRRLRGEGKHWFKAIDSQTGSTVGFAGIYSPETYNADEQSGEPSEFVNKDLLSVKEGAKTQGKDQFLVGRKDVWCE